MDEAQEAHNREAFQQAVVNTLERRLFYVPSFKIYRGVAAVKSNILHPKMFCSFKFNSRFIQGTEYHSIVRSTITGLQSCWPLLREELANTPGNWTQKRQLIGHEKAGDAGNLASGNMYDAKSYANEKGRSSQVLDDLFVIFELMTFFVVLW
ncbi:hypothetical protein Vadar_032970 [Vaccinium darrowii]|uniref:Uncharacterized protein n=1 Tax=Vaccinium darrowii TaxID=229202 RepID=A0ACB7X6B7_9ERIC|nr:hypothetical protein Vadar_032970 [Vaccinium darrowii]